MRKKNFNSPYCRWTTRKPWRHKHDQRAMNVRLWPQCMLGCLPLHRVHKAMFRCSFLDLNKRSVVSFLPARPMIATLPLRPTVNNGTILPKKVSGTLPSPSGCGSKKDNSTAASKRYLERVSGAYHMYDRRCTSSFTHFISRFSFVKVIMNHVFLFLFIICQETFLATVLSYIC